MDSYVTHTGRSDIIKVKAHNLKEVILEIMGADGILNLTGNSLSFYEKSSVDFNKELNCYILKGEDTMPSILEPTNINVQFEVDEQLQTISLGGNGRVCVNQPKELELPKDEEDINVRIVVAPEMIAYLGDIPNKVFIPGPDVRTNEYKFRGHLGLIQIK